ncbi:MAG TPA: histidine kinase dimerization/phospho-acceptor domain-containing protein [Chthoniobacterales bacterium]
MKPIRLPAVIVTIVALVLAVALAGWICWHDLKRVGGHPGSGGRTLVLHLALLALAGAGMAAAWTRWREQHEARAWADFAQRVAQSRQAGGRVPLFIDVANPQRLATAREVNVLLAEIAQAREQLNRFSAKVAHELRAPLTLLQLQVDYAADRLDPELAESLRSQIRRLAEFAETALLLARAEKGSIPVAKELLNLTDLVPELLRPFELRAKTHRRHLRLVIHPTQTCWIDAKIFGLIFNNLLSNAFFHGSGEIRVCVRPRRHGSELAVLNHVRRRGDAYAGHEAGTGMGLNTIRVLSEAHQGVTVETRERWSIYVALIRVSEGQEAKVKA